MLDPRLEIISTILEYLPVQDLCRFARVSKQLQEMVYDDSRWVHKLKLMGVWNETEARRRFEDAMRRRRTIQAAKAEERKALQNGAKTPNLGLATGPPAPGVSRTSTLFDAGEEEDRVQAQREACLRRAGLDAKRRTVAGTITEGVDLMNLAPLTPIGAPRLSIVDPGSLLKVLPSIKSVRGFARHEFGRIYTALGPLYFDLAKAKTHTDPVVFRIYRDPEQQAQVLAQLKVFAQCDTAHGWMDRLERLNLMIGIFENAALREFEGGYETGDIDGRMRRYANVLILLNGGQACVQLFVQKHPVMFERGELGSPMDSFDKSMPGSFSLEPSLLFFTRLSALLHEQADVIDRVFPATVNVMIPFLERVAEDVISEFVTPILDEAHDRDIEQYLEAVAGIYHRLLEFAKTIKVTKGSGERFAEDTMKIMGRVFEAHVDLYLQDELDYFRKKCETEVDSWEKKILEEDAAAESFFMSNINREADKRDFLSTFKKVILMPVSVIPSPFSAKSTPAAETKPAETSSYANSNTLSVQETLNASRPGTPMTLGQAAPGPPPTTELAAKAAIMNSRLEGIRSLFSLEVALNLVHSAKSSLERAALFASAGGQTGEEAREQCEQIFIALLRVLGPRHVKAGFDKAVEHLSKYNPREITEHSQPGVAPLVTFLELVNVGDLIQQMIDVFYEQELVAAKLTDPKDFLNPAAKEKKRFEQMLDERVAAGLNMGIDVLIDEVDHLFAITQQTTDFNPGAIGDASLRDFDIGPTKTAIRVIEVVSSHTRLLTGSTDKNVLDVFNQEVGVRLFASLCKHIKRQRISVDGAIKLISDLNHYHSYITTLKIKPLVPYFNALRELSQIYLIDPSHAKQMAAVIADPNRFGGIFRVEEVYEYATRREDWYRVKKEVERAMYGIGCCVS
ncbi:exocyst complex component Sec10-domain-containing protein [Tuber indicum]|nr:exocyst complex component Sec10-domain-containing protein [Tuber indicum]